MKNQELGMDIEKIMVLKGPEVDLGANSQSTFQAFKNEVTGHHSISAVAGSVLIPGQVNNTSAGDLRKLGEPASAAPYGRGIYVGLDFPETYGFEFIAGSSFTPDMSDEEFVIINEEAVRAYGLGSPENAIQEQLIGEEGVYRIIGVVKNFHWHSLRDAHTPYLFFFEGDAHSYISFKINLSNIPESLAHIETTYRSFFPNNPFDYFFLENEFNQQYQSDMQFGNLFFAFTILAIFIACIGLFALVSYSATLRIKEIGIRKVFGASVGNLMILLSREYMILLCIAIALAVPAIIIGGKAWLENYAYKVGMGVDLFLIPGLILVIISFLTVSYRTYATARANPAESLRTE
jgi:putative ABC transport system permease protein